MHCQTAMCLCGDGSKPTSFGDIWGNDTSMSKQIQGTQIIHSATVLTHIIPYPFWVCHMVPDFFSFGLVMTSRRGLFQAMKFTHERARDLNMVESKVLVVSHLKMKLPSRYTISGKMIYQNHNWFSKWNILSGT